MSLAQTTSCLYMVAPTTFGFDEQTAQTNAFQHQLATSTSEGVTQLAMQEFNEYVTALQTHDIAVHVFCDTNAQPKPNAVFSNNWLSTWPDGIVYLYPMATPSRRAERSEEALAPLQEQFRIKQVVDLSPNEASGVFLESTGVLIFDHPARVAYACISPRCDETLLANHVKTLGYELVAFHAFDPLGTPVYHTNVMLGIQSKTAVIYSQGIIDETERAFVLESLSNSGHTIIDISSAQLVAFCGNVLNVQNKHGDAFVLLSQTAFDAFSVTQRGVLARSGELLEIAIPTIEAVGGGSARCMVTEIFLPPA